MIYYKNNLMLNTSDRSKLQIPKPVGKILISLFPSYIKSANLFIFINIYKIYNYISIKIQKS